MLHGFSLETKNKQIFAGGKADFNSILSSDKLVSSMTHTQSLAGMFSPIYVSLDFVQAEFQKIDQKNSHQNLISHLNGMQQ